MDSSLDRRGGATAGLTDRKIPLRWSGALA
jgi:hypothetical protein